jgi:hypothetical protein
MPAWDGQHRLEPLALTGQQSIEGFWLDKVYLPKSLGSPLCGVGLSESSVESVESVERS